MYDKQPVTFGHYSHALPKIIVKAEKEKNVIINFKNKLNNKF